ncbi:MAG: 30S ribosome-binding factor RbfA [Bacteroidota bacterium]
MDSKRQNKYAKLIQKEISEIFLHHGKGYYGNNFITITTVKVSPDLSLVKIFISLFNVKDGEKVISEINNHTKEIRKHLGERMKNQIRHIPELVFYIDDSAEYAENIEKLFRNLNTDQNNTAKE